MNLSNELPSNFALKAFLSSISSIFRYSLGPYLTYMSKITALVCCRNLNSISALLHSTISIFFVVGAN